MLTSRARCCAGPALVDGTRFDTVARPCAFVVVTWVCAPFVHDTASPGTGRSRPSRTATVKEHPEDEIGHVVPSPAKRSIVRRLGSTAVAVNVAAFVPPGIVAVTVCAPCTGPSRHEPDVALPA